MKNFSEKLPLLEPNRSLTIVERTPYHFALRMKLEPLSTEMGKAIRRGKFTLAIGEMS
ncbi:MAG: hypothetical protein MK188_16250 [Gammaproteobacteria bacterium]|nr:hypothetical protein [Gammaproteobacteria bacterium]